MALRIEYFRQGEKVMVAPCLKELAGARQDARDGLRTFNADLARILDMNKDGQLLAVVKP